jgi:hypothetical protein
MGSAPYEQDYWLACAGKAYARAEGMDDPHARLTLLRVAKGYECHERERTELINIVKKRCNNEPVALNGLYLQSRG